MDEPKVSTKTPIITFPSSLPSDIQLRSPCTDINPTGFYIRHPPPPHLLSSYLTPDSQLFQTIHMGAAIVDPTKWRLVIDGLVKHPFVLTLPQLLDLPRTTITAFHECYGSPIKPPTEAVWRIGNVQWTGVRLSYLLNLAGVLPNAQFMWSEGLDWGTFHGVAADRYQKDLPLDKALSPEVLVAFEINGESLNTERGGPVRLVVPGWFGTNMTKWLCRISLRDRRATGPYTTTFYNEIDSTDPEGKRMRPVWGVEVNSIIVRPGPDAVIRDPGVVVEGWAWCCEEVVGVAVSVNGGAEWVDAEVRPREEFGWQGWRVGLVLGHGRYTVIARAVARGGTWQPLGGRRNHVHSVNFTVADKR